MACWQQLAGFSCCLLYIHGMVNVIIYEMIWSRNQALVLCGVTSQLKMLMKGLDVNTHCK